MLCQLYCLLLYFGACVSSLVAVVEGLRILGHSGLRGQGGGQGLDEDNEQWCTSRLSDQPCSMLLHPPHSLFWVARLCILALKNAFEIDHCASSALSQADNVASPPGVICLLPTFLWGYFTLSMGHLPNTFCFISPSSCFISPSNLLHFPNKSLRFPNSLLHFPNRLLHFPNTVSHFPNTFCVTLPNIE